jgi:hypothetical protein
MALGHDRNMFMLIEALKDPSEKIRISAVEHCSMLESKVASAVLKEACVSPHDETREMGWSLLGPHPAENKAPVLMAAIERGGDKGLEEAFLEIGRVPEQLLFEAMLGSATQVKGARQARVLKELQHWLEPGGMNPPQFRNVGELVDWWKVHKIKYDQWMLRIDG